MTKLTSFQADIRPLFTERDVQGMSKGFNLASYDDVKARAAAIYDRIRGIGGAVMPPPPPRGQGPWPQSRIELFAKWMADGFPSQSGRGAPNGSSSGDIDAMGQMSEVKDIVGPIGLPPSLMAVSSLAGTPRHMSQKASAAKPSICPVIRPIKS